MVCIELPRIYVELLEELEQSGIDYLTLLETVGNQCNVEGYIANVDPSQATALKQKIARLNGTFDFATVEQGKGIVIYKKEG